MGPSQPPEILSKQSGTHAASRALSQEGRGVGVGVDVDVDVDEEEEEETKLPDRHSIAVAKKNFSMSVSRSEYGCRSLPSVRPGLYLWAEGDLLHSLRKRYKKQKANAGEWGFCTLEPIWEVQL